MTINSDLHSLQHQLNDFDPLQRADALAALHALAASRDIELPQAGDLANMHCHTFFSYNAYGYSPSGLAWLARERGYKLLGIVDFDVLDAVDEFLAACDVMSVRGSAGIETRAFLPEFATREINSPGEPGVLYHMGIGFTGSTIPAEVTGIAAELRERARRRNLSVLARVNAYLDPVTIDYAADVLPLTPAGNATERHMVVAYVQAARRAVVDPAGFWAEKLGLPKADLELFMGETGDAPAFQNLIRSKLMKRGGVGYVQPDSGSFPTVEAFHRLIEACGALPCAAWLDGTTAGEQAMEELLALLISKGVVALNIVPDRNWNIADPALKQRKLANLYAVVELAQALDLPLNVGTEMNSFGNKLVDDFASSELQPVRQAFLDGAYFIYGHTLLQRAADLGYQSDWAKALLPTRKERNDFYTRAGCAVEPGRAAFEQLRRQVNETMTPGELLGVMRDA